MLHILQIIFYNPIYNLVVFLLNYIQDFGIVVILITIIVKTILFPIQKAQIKSQLAMKKAQPELNELKKRQKKAKNQIEKQALAMEMIGIYRKYKIKTSAILLPIFVQLPLLFSLYFIFYSSGFPKIDTSIIYNFVNIPENINMLFLNIINLNNISWVLAILSGLAQFLTFQVTMPEIKFNDVFKKTSNEKIKESFGKNMQWNMKFILPFFIVILLITIPKMNNTIALYWITVNIITAIQEFIIRKDKQALKSNIKEVKVVK